MYKAVALFSGGLDSQLAVRLIQDQGLEVIGVYFQSPFFSESSWVTKAAQNLGISLQTHTLGEEYFALLKNPRYGFGKNLNPCIDCHGLMLKVAGQYMEQIHAHFLITGEVLKQRPKSQRLDALHLVEKLSGYPGLVLRPLSARLLPATLPEKKGWVDREKLLALSGRSRKPQLELAETYGLKDYPSPAGGCLLTVPSFAERLRLLLDRKPDAGYQDFERLKVGRHFFGPDGFYLIVGRKKSENEFLEKQAGEPQTFLKAASHPGPLALLQNLDGVENEAVRQEQLRVAGGITARYSDARELSSVEIKCWNPAQATKIFTVSPLDPLQATGIIQK